MKIKVFLLIQLLLFFFVSEVYGGLLGTIVKGFKGIFADIEPKPVKPEHHKNTKCKRTCYRPYDGFCNNLNNPTWGMPGTLFTRLFDSYSYDDGKCKMPDLPNPREISLAVFPNIPCVDDPVRTLFTVAFGQLVAHDESLASGAPQTGAQAISCNCVNGKLTTKYPENDRCAPIEIPNCDPYNTPEGVECFDFVRTRSTCHDEKCPSKPGEQYNAVTSYLDLSPLYGNNEEQANNLRKFKHGMLNYVMIDGRMYPPQTSDSAVCNVEGASKPLCIVTGDFRANQNPHIALMQIILLRYHNYIAKKLCKKINPCWSDEKCYQEARRIVIAVYQHICYNEYLPLLLGTENMIKHGLIQKHPKGCIDGYDDTVNPSAINEHSTAAFRSLHSTILGFFSLFDKKRKEHDEIRLSNTFNNASFMMECKNELYLAIGAVTQKQMHADRFHSPEITNYLFRSKDKKLGLDLLAIDIQRTRDHGLAPYPVAMEQCGFGRPKRFEDFKFISPENIELLKKIYKRPSEVELRVAGQLETVPEGQLTGPTFNCIMIKQYKRLKFGDAHFYAFKQKCEFSKDQLKEIRSMSFAKLICQNAGKFNIQPRAFEIPSSDNKIGPCCDLPCIDLTKWKEDC